MRHADLASVRTLAVDLVRAASALMDAATALVAEAAVLRSRLEDMERRPAPGVARPGTLLDSRDAARYLGLKPGTLHSWRVRGRGPAFVKLGRSVRYHTDALDEFLSTHAH